MRPGCVLAGPGGAAGMREFHGSPAVLLCRGVGLVTGAGSPWGQEVTVDKQPFLISCLARCLCSCRGLGAAARAGDRSWGPCSSKPPAGGQQLGLQVVCAQPGRCPSSEPCLWQLGVIRELELLPVLAGRAGSAWGWPESGLEVLSCSLTPQCGQQGQGLCP